jgi:hypothetical protein
MNESTSDERKAILDGIRQVVSEIGGKRPTREQLVKKLGIPWRRVEHFFPNQTMTSAVAAAGYTFDRYHAKIRLVDWLMDWGEVVRRKGSIPGLKEYKHKAHGAKYSPGVFENDPGGGRWSLVPLKFRGFAKDKPEWADVVAKLPQPDTDSTDAKAGSAEFPETLLAAKPRYSRLENRPTYGNPINFRGLRHEPVNEQGVVFLFGMVAKELGYMVEAVQVGFPDCKAKRQVEGGRWQSVKIEFEFESRNYNHPEDGCDVIVCWRHNWPNCPHNIEIVELSKIIKSLAKSED